MFNLVARINKLPLSAWVRQKKGRSSKKWKKCFKPTNNRKVTQASFMVLNPRIVTKRRATENSVFCTDIKKFSNKNNPSYPKRTKLFLKYKWLITGTWSLCFICATRNLCFRFVKLIFSRDWRSGQIKGGETGFPARLTGDTLRVMVTNKCCEFVHESINYDVHFRSRPFPLHKLWTFVNAVACYWLILLTQLETRAKYCLRGLFRAIWFWSLY